MWWKESVFYQIYMPSFCDSNNDGMGDFIGITENLNYLKELGVDCIWLTPYYKSPKVDNGYDIEDYYSIDPDYGNEDEFVSFIKRCKELNIRVIADLVLNHTSNKNKWFIKSKSSLNNDKRGWYIWKAGKKDISPNNWESFFNGSAWEYDDNTKQYYYHAFAKEQVDLNWANAEVKEEMFNVMRFWLDKGIDGFRLDVINFLTVNDNFIDNPYNDKGEQEHIYDKDQEGILEIIKELREFIDKYDDKFLVGEIGSDELDTIIRYVGKDKLHTTFNFNLGSMDKLNVENIFNELKDMNKKYKDDLPTLFFSSHDMARFSSRFNLNDDGIKLMATLMLTFRGIPFIYFGDEIGMRDLKCSDINEMRDIQGRLAYEDSLRNSKSLDEAMEAANNKSRDKSRNPMRWNGGEFAGFSKIDPWIKDMDVDNIYNVNSQSNIQDSILNYYKEIIKIRKENKCLCYGECCDLNLDNNVISYKRIDENDEIIIVLNFNNFEVKYKRFNEYKLIKSNKERNHDKLSGYLKPMESVVLKKM